MPLQCPRCGRQNEKGSQVCVSCGASFVAPPQSAPRQKPVAPAAGQAVAHEAAEGQDKAQLGAAARQGAIQPRASGEPDLSDQNAQCPYQRDEAAARGGFPSPCGFNFPSMLPCGAYPAYCFFPPPMPFYSGYPPYSYPYAPSYYSLPGVPGAPGFQVAQAMYPASYARQYAARPRKRGKALYVVLIIIGILLLIGGAVTTAVLMTAKGSVSFKLGNDSVTGVDIKFRNLVLKQEGRSVTLLGEYDNNTKRDGNVSVIVQATSSGSDQALSFTVPVEPGKSMPVNQKKALLKKLSGATLGALIYQGSSSGRDTGTDTYPWDSEDNSFVTPDQPSTPSSDGVDLLNNTSPGTTPFSN